MPTRISTGTNVQTTSISVLWVVRDGTGLALALNFTTTVTSSASTNSVITMMSTDRKSWNQTILSITGEPEAWRCHSHGSGCPSSANAAPPVASVRPATANPSKCRPTGPIDIFMPFALPLRNHPNALPIFGERLFDPPVRQTAAQEYL